MLDCLLGFFLVLWVDFIALDLASGGGEEEGGGSPPPPPPPPAANAGMTGGAAISAIEKIASVTKLVASLIMPASCFAMWAVPPAAPVNPALPRTFPRKFRCSRKGGSTRLLEQIRKRKMRRELSAQRAIANRPNGGPRPARVVAGRPVLPDTQTTINQGGFYDGFCAVGSGVWRLSV